MEISEILINHMHEPMGFQLQDLRIEFQVIAEEFVEAKKKLSIWTADAQEPIFQKEEKYTNNFFDIEIALQPRTRYFVGVELITSEKTIQGESFFETGKIEEPFQAEWIGSVQGEFQNTLLKKAIRTTKKIIQARLYMTGLGVYETLINQQKVGEEFLAPGITAYDQWIQVQTYDITSYFDHSGIHELCISLGDGWFKGRMGFEGGQEKIYGSQQMAIAEYHLLYEDGQEEVIGTDTSWQTTDGKITKSAIYYGEDFDATKEVTGWQSADILSQDKTLLQDRLSLPIKKMDSLPVEKIIETPLNEQVLDFGQNQAGWIEFYNREPKGTRIIFEMGEILQNGNFYRENLREARAAFVYISDGENGWIRPHFTYYGYRYVKVSGTTLPLRPEDYCAAVMYSEMKTTGGIVTNNPKVNRLFQNVMWGQKSNFFDVPTDCPQRDERLGWTGDASVFVSTAAFNMDVFAFFKKYMKDIAIEQQLHEGRTPMYAPAFGNLSGGPAVWGDAATIIPWQMYQTTGDLAILKQNYSEMKAWVDWISHQTTTSYLWTGSFQFGDWLALDGENPALPTGKTDENFIASVYYYYSAQIVANTAILLEKKQDFQAYRELAHSIKRAIREEFISATGRLTIDTQTAYALALYFELVEEQYIPRVVKDLLTRLDKDQNHLQTGFVGTPFICQVLSKYGEHKRAVQIFLQEDLPSWLYAVNLGATTIWERWDSVQPDGTLNPSGMNSLNHYSIGAVMEWAYCYLLGIQRKEAGYQAIILAPCFDYRFNQVTGYYETAYGKLIMDYQIETDKEHTIQINLSIPFGMNVQVELPRARQVVVNGFCQEGPLHLVGGQYIISYQPTGDYIERYHEGTSVSEIMQDTELVKKIDAIDPVLSFFKTNYDALEDGLGMMSLMKLNEILPFVNISDENLKQIHQLLAKTPIVSKKILK